MSRIPLPPLVLMVAAAACARRAPVQPTPPAGAERAPAQPTTPAVAERVPAQPTPSGDEDPISEIGELADLLSTAPLGVDTVVQRIGPITEDYGQDGLYIAPSNRRFQEAWVALHPETGEPDLVELDPAATQQLTAGALRAAFGPYEYMSSLHSDVPGDLLFDTAPPGAPCEVLLIAHLAEVGDDPPPTAAIVSITLRRECS